MKMNRRTLLCNAVKLAVVGAVGANLSKAYASAEDAMKKIGEFAGGAAPTEGRISLKAPEIAENGNTVPISFEVDSPMTEDDFVESVMIVAEGNPLPGVATFHFSSASGTCRASTRMRLAKTQRVVAIAKMNDGSVFTDARDIKVTIGGCGG